MRAVFTSAAFVAAVAVLPMRADQVRSAVPAQPDTRTIVHVLNRLGFGPAPGDVERVARLGLAAYIEQQLHPESLPDAAMSARLAGFETLGRSSRDLAEHYFLPAQQARRAAQQRASSAGTAMAAPDGRPDPDMRPKPTPAMQAARRVIVELTGQKVFRAAYSDRQLEEVMVDFWFNHFNVFAGKGQTRLYLTEYERDTIRPHALGKFKDLLAATAHSPAMLFFLDNWQSAAPRTMPNGRARGINENYARELMELHTLGVDGGYTQRDVQEVARAFTGWTIETPRTGGGFRFEPRLHDNGEKIVLGHRIRAGGGERDGEQVLDMLARHPATATFIATKLARRFVSDVPPPALVARAAAVFRSTDGDIREVVRAIVTSPEFFAADAYRAKVKTPFEFVASALRTSGIDVRNPQPFVQALRELGMPAYECQPPTGYADRADAWVNTGALLARMNFAVALTGGRMRGGRGAGGPIADLATLRDQFVDGVLAGDISDATRTTVARAEAPAQALALLLGSPEFQKR